MKKILLSLAAISALAAAASPAAAQSYGRYDPRYEDRFDGDARLDRSDRIERRIDRAQSNGRLTPREAATLRAQVRSVEHLEWRYRRDGRITRWEHDDLQRRYAHLEARLRYERNDRDYGYGYGPGWR